LSQRIREPGLGEIAQLVEARHTLERILSDDPNGFVAAIQNEACI
jgi:hypothetical protein